LRIGIADTIFGGDDAAKVLAFAGNLDELEETAHRLGITLDNTAVESALKFDQALESVRGVLQGIVNQVMPVAAEWITAIANAINYGWQVLWRWGQQWVDSGSSASWVLNVMGTDMSTASQKAAAMALVFERVGHAVVLGLSPIIGTLEVIINAMVKLGEGDIGGALGALAKAPGRILNYAEQGLRGIVDDSRLAAIEAEILELFPNINEPFGGADIRKPELPEGLDRTFPGGGGIGDGKGGDSGGRFIAIGNNRIPYPGPNATPAEVQAFLDAKYRAYAQVASQEAWNNRQRDVEDALTLDSGPIASGAGRSYYSGGGGSSGGRSSANISITNIFQLAYKDDDIIDAVIKATEQNVLQIAGAV